MNCISSINAQRRCFRKIILESIPVTNANFNSPVRNPNGYSLLYAYYTAPQPLPGWTITGTNSTLYICNGVSAFCNFVSNQNQYVFLTLDATGAIFSMSQTININYRDLRSYLFDM
jgi:hypothetical protein